MWRYWNWRVPGWELVDEIATDPSKGTLWADFEEWRNNLRTGPSGSTWKPMIDEDNLFTAIWIGGLPAVVHIFMARKES